MIWRQRSSKLTSAWRRFFEVLVQINSALTQPTVATPTTARSISPPTVDDLGEACLNGAKVKVPKLSLPHFNGELMKWPTFWDSYASAIHITGELTKIDNSTI